MAPSPPPAPPAAAAAALSPLFTAGNVFKDVSQELPTHWQLVDGASLLIKKARATGGFYQDPESLAGIDALIEQLDHLIQGATRKSKDISAAGGPTPTPQGDDLFETDGIDEHAGETETEPRN